MDAVKRTRLHASELDLWGVGCRAARWFLGTSLAAVHAVSRWNRTRRDMEALLGMSDHLLKDLGINRDDLLLQRKHWSRGR